MAQAYTGEKMQETPSMDVKETKRTSHCSSVPFKFNAQAPEFVPRSNTEIPISGYFHPYFHFLNRVSSAASDCFFLGDQEPTYLIPNPTVSLPNSSKNVITNDIQQKIIKQVEYQFSDMSLLANETLAKHVSKDPDGYVPISVIGSTKKIKSLSSNSQLLTQALRSSPKLVVSDDGKKVRRKHPFTEKDKEDLQSRTVVVENLPENHSHQNLEKLFGLVGRVKTIRICHPPESNSSRPKGEFLISNKVEKLNDERNWRKGLRVRLLLRCSPKSVLRTRNSEFDSIIDEEEEAQLPECNGKSSLNGAELITDGNTEESSMGSKKGWSRGHGKGRGRGPSHSGRGLLVPSQQSNISIQCETSAKQHSKGPRMPDGTRGFTMGRGKPLSA